MYLYVWICILKNHAFLVSSYPHPYGPELDAFAPAGWMVEATEPALYGRLADTAFTYVDTLEALQDLKLTLNSVKEFAIDLEAHQYRSFSGFVCLMQVSTRDEDFIGMQICPFVVWFKRYYSGSIEYRCLSILLRFAVDTLALRSHMFILNEPFTNPAIVKVCVTLISLEASVLIRHSTWLNGPFQLSKRDRGLA